MVYLCLQGTRTVVNRGGSSPTSTQCTHCSPVLGPPGGPTPAHFHRHPVPSSLLPWYIPPIYRSPLPPGRDSTSVAELSPWLKPRPSVHDAITSSRAARIAASTERLLGKSTPLASTNSPPGPLVPTGSTHPKPLHSRGQAPYPSSDGVSKRTSAPKPLPPLGQAPYPSSDGVSERTSAPKPLPPLGQAPYPLSDGVPECSLHTPYPFVGWCACASLGPRTSPTPHHWHPTFGPSPLLRTSPFLECSSTSPHGVPVPMDSLCHPT